jgi:hypothetical protein
MKFTERECDESICDLCGEKHTFNEYYNYQYVEWDKVCDECFDWEVEKSNSEYSEDYV